MLFLLIGIWGLAACEVNVAEVQQPVWQIHGSEEYRARQAAYLRHCADTHGPGLGGRYGQVCLVAAGRDAYNIEALDEILAKIAERRDTSDFDLTALLRMLWLDRQTGALPDDVRSRIERAVLDFKYWFDEPGPDSMVWWSENHQILFHALEYLAGHLFPDRVFSNAGMTGREHVAHAEPWLRRWLFNRARFGFSEFHSNVYFEEDMPALINLVDFAPDERIRAQAAILLDTIVLDMASNYYKGFFATAHGRTYPDRLIGGLRDSVRDAAWLLFQGVPVSDVTALSGDSFSAAFLATSAAYAPPPLLERYAATVAPGLEHRQRDGIRIADGPAWGIGYERWEDVIFWWGMTGYVAPAVIEGSFRMIENFDMWKGATWSDLTPLRLFVDTSVLRKAAEEFAVMAQGIALEEANTYVYRTPHYQLAGVQDYKPGFWTGQVHAWKATLAERVHVFTTWPGGSEGTYMGGDWTGGFLPRVMLEGSVGLIRYPAPALPSVAERLLGFVEEAGFGLRFKEFTHAHFPRDEFDEVVTGAGWTIGRVGESYVGLWSRRPTTWATENRFELIAAGPDNDWVIELGSRAEQGDFAAFAARLMAAPIGERGGRLRYVSPFQGTFEAGLTGALLHDGRPVDLGPYPRWDNPYVYQPFGDRRTELHLDGECLVLEFDDGRRASGGACLR